MSELFLSLLVVAIPVGTRVFLSRPVLFAGEYGTVFLSVSDVALAFFVLSALWQQFRNLRTESIRTSFPVALFFFFAILSVLFAPSKILALVALLRLIFFLAASFFAVKLFVKPKVLSRILALFAVLAVLEATVGIFQFSAQGSIGLARLGEPHLILADPTIARTIVGDSPPGGVAGGRAIRAYGTFPHPNVFAAFLLIGLFSLYYFWFRAAHVPFQWNTHEKRAALFRRYLPILIRTAVLSGAIFIILVGLALSFSRVAWALALILTLLLSSYFLFHRDSWRQALKLVVVFFTSIVFILVALAPFITPRLHISTSEPSVIERTAYFRLGLEVIRTHPFGVGIGNQVPFALQHGLYEQFGLTKPTLHQPIHNVYLLMASEIGMLGLAAFLWFIGAIIWQGVKTLNFKLKTFSTDSSLITSYLLLITLLFFGLFDHFLWTLDQGRLMLWLAIGMVMAVAKI